jgi:hypothetical protein
MNAILLILNNIENLPAEDQEGLTSLLLRRREERTRLRLLEQDNSQTLEAIGEELSQGREADHIKPQRGPLGRGVSLMSEALNDLYRTNHEAIHKDEWFTHVQAVASAQKKKPLARSTFEAYIHHTKKTWEGQGGGYYIPQSATN